MPGAVGEQGVHGVAGQPDPAAAGEVLLDHLPPDGDRHPEGRLPVPGDGLDLEAAVPVNAVPEKSISSGTSPSVRAAR